MFASTCPKPVKDINQHLLHEWGIIGGYDLVKDYERRTNEMLIAVTEMVSREDMEMLLDALQEVSHA